MLESAAIMSKIEKLKEEYTSALAVEMSSKCIEIVPEPVVVKPVITIENDFVAYHAALDANAPVKVGEIFRCSWGYSMTIVDYYVITEISKTGKSVKIKAIGGEIISGGGYSGMCRPDPKGEGSSVHLGSPANFKRLKKGYND
jgi:hypothetical protein